MCPDDTWSFDRHVAVSTLEAVRELSWLFASAHSKTPPPQPKRIRRPGEPDEMQAAERRVRQLRDFYASNKPTGDEPADQQGEGVA